MNNSISLELVHKIEDIQRANDDIFKDLAEKFSKGNKEGFNEISDNEIRQTIINNYGLSEKEFDEQFPEISKHRVYPKSKFQNRSVYYQLTLLWESVDRLTRKHYPKEYKIFPVEVASAYTGSINACTKTNENRNEFAIIYDETILPLSLLLSEIYVQTIPFIEENNGTYSMSLKDSDIESKIKASDNKVIDGFFDLFKSIMQNGENPCTVERYCKLSSFKGPEWNAIWIKQGFDLFIMAHEYGHIHLNHFEDAGVGNDKDKLNAFNQICELEADRFAMEIVIRDSVENKIFPFCAIVGALLFFEYKLFIECCLYLSQFGKDIRYEPDYYLRRCVLDVKTDDHPHSLIRKYKLLDSLKKSNLNNYGLIDCIANFIEKVSNILWNKSFDKLKNLLYDQKITIHPIWNEEIEKIIKEKELGSRHS